MICIHCKIRPAGPKHHIIPKSQGGSDNEINKAPLCVDWHYEWHHGIDTEKVKAIKKTCYDQIRNRLDECWKGKIKPKIARLIEIGEL